MPDESESLFTRFEIATTVAKMSQDVYTAHIHAGHAFISPVRAVQLAAQMLGLAQSDAVYRLVHNAAGDTKDAAGQLTALWSEVANRVTEDYKSRAQVIVQAMQAAKPDSS